jgi:hypothetical protein
MRPVAKKRKNIPSSPRADGYSYSYSPGPATLRCQARTSIIYLLCILQLCVSAKLPCGCYRQVEREKDRQRRLPPEKERWETAAPLAGWDSRVWGCKRNGTDFARNAIPTPCCVQRAPLRCLYFLFPLVFLRPSCAISISCIVGSHLPQSVPVVD